MNSEKIDFKDFILLFINQRKIISLVFIALIIFFGGIRFSDINILSLISNDSGLKDFFFNKNLGFYGISSEFIYDSPLKIYLIKIIPLNIFFIAFIFLCLSFLPFFFIFIKDRFSKFLILSIFLFTPLLKILFLNIGTGDGFIIFLIISTFLFQKKFLIGLFFFFIGLWHPQQSFFIFISYFLGDLCFSKNFNFKRFITCLLLILISFIIFFIHKKYLFPGTVSRFDIFFNNYYNVFSRNLKIGYLSHIFFLLSIWFYYFRPINIGYKYLLYIWVFLLTILSLSVLDSSRVLIITILPLICFVIKNLYENNNCIKNKYLIYLIIFLNMITPTISWSGYDWMNYYDLKNDICNHIQICF